MGVGTDVDVGTGVGVGAGVGDADGNVVGMKTLMIGSGFLPPRAALMLTLLIPANAAPATTIATAQVIAFFTTNYPATRRAFRPSHGRYVPGRCNLR